MPNGIILFNYMDDSIVFENQMVEDILKKKSPKFQSNNDLISVNEIAEEKDDENMYDTIIIKEITEQEQKTNLKKQMNQHKENFLKGNSASHSSQNSDQKNEKKTFMQTIKDKINKLKLKMQNQ